MARYMVALVAGVGLLAPATVFAQDWSLVRPVARGEAGLVLASEVRPRARPEAATRSEARPMTADLSQSFAQWRSAFEARARAKGISAATLDRARSEMVPLAEVIARDRNQSEFVKPIWDYLDSAASDTRIANGQAMLATHSALLDRIEARFEVPREIVVAVWGMESAYGSFRGDTNILAAMATLAHEGRRGAFFEEQLLAALQIVETGGIAPSELTGSWAGAMGHTQFIPTSYLAYAVDFDGDGRADIWSDDPTDALASTAAYLARSGWKRGLPWGVEVRLPEGFDYTQARRDVTLTPADWQGRGVTILSDTPLPADSRASILLPAGAGGVALMISSNFRAIERYNAADAYVIGVGHLSDRLRGGAAFLRDWPRGDSPLLSAERRELQRLLTSRGFDTKGVDGRIGPNSISAIRAFQVAEGLTPDGYPSKALLQRLR